MPVLKSYVIWFFGYYQKGNASNPDKPTHVLDKKKFSKAFKDEQEARSYARANLESYMPKDNYIQRWTDVDDIVELASPELEESQTSEDIQINVIANLKSIVTDFCEALHKDEEQWTFMNRLLKSKLEMSGNLLEYFSVQAKYIADILIKQRPKDLRQFHRKVTDDFLRSQMEHQIINFLKKAPTTTKGDSKQVSG